MAVSMLKLLATGSLVAAMLAWQPLAARAADVVAIVEMVSGPASGVQRMDILEEGRVIELGEGATLTLGYFRSCIRETITGGSVTVGADRSQMENGKRHIEKVDCDGGTRIETKGAKSDLLGMVIRKGNQRSNRLPKSQWTVYGTDPVLHLTKPTNRIVIERLDKETGTTIDLVVKGKLIDLAKAGVRLEPGGLYSISLNSAIYVIKVSPLAEQKVPLLSRFVPM